MRGQDAREMMSSGGGEPLKRFLCLLRPERPPFERGIGRRHGGVEFLTSFCSSFVDATLEFGAEGFELAAPGCKTLQALSIQSIRVSLTSRDRLSNRDIESVHLRLRSRGRLLE